MIFITNVSVSISNSALIWAILTILGQLQGRDNLSATPEKYKNAYIERWIVMLRLGGKKVNSQLCFFKYFAVNIFHEQTLAGYIATDQFSSQLFSFSAMMSSLR